MIETMIVIGWNKVLVIYLIVIIIIVIIIIIIIHRIIKIAILVII